MDKSKLVKCEIITGYNNCVKCSKSPAEKSSHRFTKFAICDWLWNNGLNFGTEVVFINGARADIVIYEWGLIIEVLNTESYDMFVKKSYPFPALPIYCKENPLLIRDILDDLKCTNGEGADYYIKKQGERNV